MLAKSLLLLLFGVVTLTRAQLPQVHLFVNQYEQSPLEAFSSVPIVEGTSPLINCTSTIAGNTTWTVNGRTVQQSNHYIFFGGGSALAVMDFEPSDAGNYTCIVETRAGIVSSQSVQLQLAFITTSFFGSADFPFRYTVTEGQPISLSCGNISALPTTKFVDWERRIRRSTFRPLESGVVHTPDGSLLFQQPSRANDGSVYRCNVGNGLLRDTSFGYIQLSVTPANSPAPLQVAYGPQDVVTRLGSVASFYCIPGGSGSFDAVVKWTYPPSIRSRLEYFDSMRRHELLIDSIRREDAGTYSCTVGNVTKSATLTVVEPPTLTTTLSAVSVLYGDRLDLTCSAQSITDVTWSWYFNGTRIPDATGSTYSHPSTTIQNAGTYQCFAWNIAGYNQSSSTIQVTVIPATLEPLPQEILVFRGQPFSLLCNASGLPVPLITWINGMSDTVSSDSLLAIPEADQDEQYHCVAKSVSDDLVLSSATNFTAVRVIDPTVFTVQSGEVFEAQVGTRAEFVCSVNHSRNASVELQWTKYGQPVNSQANRLTLVSEEEGQLRLVIEQVMTSDAGPYQCIAQTRQGTLLAPVVRSQITSFRVLRTPVVPSIHKVTGTSPNSFEVQWSFSGDLSHVSRYIIEVQNVQKSSSGYSQLLEWSVNAITRAEVSNPDLKAYTEYNVRVTVVFLDGTLASSEPRVVRTGIDVPLDPPRDLDAIPLDQHTIEIHWKSPTMPQGPIRNYVVSYRDSGSNGSFTVEKVGNVTQHKLTNLDAFTGYEVQVAAETEAGTGPFTTPINATFLLFSGSNSANFVRSIGFIVLVVAVALTGSVVVVIAVLIWRRRFVQKQARNYHVRNSVYFGKGATVDTEHTDVHLSEHAVASYFSRHKRAFSSSSPTTPKSQAMPMTRLETESSFGGTERTISTQIISTSGSGIVPRLQSPPGYIDPPDVFSDERYRHSRSHSAFSGRSDGDDKDYVEMRSASSSTTPSALKKDQEFHYGEDSDNSVEKATLNSSSNDGSERDLESMQNSQLTGQYDTLPPTIPPTIPNSYMIPTNHGWGLPYGRSRSDGRVRTGSASGRAGNGAYNEVRRGAVSVAAGMETMTVGQMVEERLRAQSPHEGIMTHATYV